MRWQQEPIACSQTSISSGESTYKVSCLIAFPSAFEAIITSNFLLMICFFSAYRTILEDSPCHVHDGLTTIHFPDIHISFFRLLLDFLYSGQTYVPVHELEQLQDLLALLQIKPNIWRSGDSKKDIVNSKSSIKFYFWHPVKLVSREHVEWHSFIM